MLIFLLSYFQRINTQHIIKAYDSELKILNVYSIQISDEIS